MMNHMFELFHSTKGNRGTGIGLAVAKKDRRRARRHDHRQKHARRRHDVHGPAARLPREPRPTRPTRTARRDNAVGSFCIFKVSGQRWSTWVNAGLGWST